MALGFYQTVRTVPLEVQEAARMFHLSAWQRFWRIDVPYSMPSLLWNTMASMSAGWFFVVATEAITVSNQKILLPGIGSYISVAIGEADLRAISYAIIAMLIVILIYDQLLFRPLVAWAERFKAEHQAAESDQIPESWVIDLFRRTRIIRSIGAGVAHLFDMFVNINFFRHVDIKSLSPSRVASNQRWSELLYNLITLLIGAGAFIFLWAYIARNIELSEIFHVFLLVDYSVSCAIPILCSLVWVPVGIWIGLRPRGSICSTGRANSRLFSESLYPFIVVLL